MTTILEFLNSIDTQLYLFFNSMHTPFLDKVMMLSTSRFIWVPLYISIAVLLVKSYGVKLSLIYLLAIGAAIAITDQTCASFIRPLVERMRPSNPDNTLSSLATLVDGYRGGRYGFPSCHAANSFALAVFVCSLIRKPGVTLFLFSWAIFNSYTRLYLGVHYPGDLLVGALVGSGVGYLMYRVNKHFFPAAKEKALAAMQDPLITLHIGLNFYGNTFAHIGVTASALMISVGVLTLLTIICGIGFFSIY